MKREKEQEERGKKRGPRLPAVSQSAPSGIFSAYWKISHTEGNEIEREKMEMTEIDYNRLAFSLPPSLSFFLSLSLLCTHAHIHLPPHLEKMDHVLHLVVCDEGEEVAKVLVVKDTIGAGNSLDGIRCHVDLREKKNE